MALAYVTWNDQLLVQEQIDEPDAGLRVPSRVVQPGESPGCAALREVRDKAGLEGTTLRTKFGRYHYDMLPLLDEVQERHVYWLEYEGERRHAWRSESHVGAQPQSEIYYWVEIEQSPNLFAGHGQYLEELEMRLIHGFEWGSTQVDAPAPETLDHSPPPQSSRRYRVEK